MLHVKYLTLGSQTSVCSTYVNSSQVLRVCKWHIFDFNNLFPTSHFLSHFLRCHLKYKAVIRYFPSLMKNGPGLISSSQHGNVFNSFLVQWQELSLKDRLWAGGGSTVCLRCTYSKYKMLWQFPFPSGSVTHMKVTWLFYIQIQ